MYLLPYIFKVIRKNALYVSCQDNECFFCLGLKLNAWKQVLNHSVNSINYNKSTYKSKLSLLKDFFAKPPVSIPQSMKNMYRFSVGEKVYVDLTPIQRKNIGFKWSLHPVFVHCCIHCKKNLQVCRVLAKIFSNSFPGQFNCEYINEIFTKTRQSC